MLCNPKQIEHQMHSHGLDGSKLSLLGGRSKRSYKRYAWNEKKRAGMSFLIVIAFFMIFALIILTEVLMIDDKNRAQTFGGGGNGIRHSGYSRFGESVPDYEDVKDEYSIEDAVFSRNRFKETKHNNKRGKYLLQMFGPFGLVLSNHFALFFQ